MKLRSVTKFYIRNTETYKNDDEVMLANSDVVLSKGTNFAKNSDFLQEYTDISKIKEVLILKGIFSKFLYACLLSYQI